MKITEEVGWLDLGDIVLLKTNLFKSPRVMNMTQPGMQHMFVVVDIDPITVSPISSNMSQVGKFEWAIPIEEWQEVGLRKPSYVGVDNYGTVRNTDVFKKIGALSPTDRTRIVTAHMKAPQRIRLEQIGQDLYEQILLD